MYNNDPMGIVSSDRNLDPPEVPKRIRDLLDRITEAEEKIENLKNERDEFLRDMKYKPNLTINVKESVISMVTYDYDCKISGWRQDIDAYNTALALEGAF